MGPLRDDVTDGLDVEAGVLSVLVETLDLLSLDDVVELLVRFAGLFFFCKFYLYKVYVK